MELAMAGGKHVSFEEWLGKNAEWEQVRNTALAGYSLYCLDIFPYFAYTFIPKSDKMSRSICSILKNLEG